MAVGDEAAMTSMAVFCVAARSSVDRRAFVPPTVSPIGRRPGTAGLVSVRRELTTEPLYCFTPYPPTGGRN